MTPNQRAARNLQYLERKKKMPLADRFGMPLNAGGDGPQPQGPAINPVLQMLWPVFAQSIHDLLAAKPEDRPYSTVLKATPRTADEIVTAAWEIANRTIERVGFEFVFPMGAKIIPPHAVEMVPPGAGVLVEEEVDTDGTV